VRSRRVSGRALRHSLSTETIGRVHPHSLGLISTLFRPIAVEAEVRGYSAEASDPFMSVDLTTITPCLSAIGSHGHGRGASSRLTEPGPGAVLSLTEMLRHGRHNDCRRIQARHGGGGSLAPPKLLGTPVLHGADSLNDSAALGPEVKGSRTDLARVPVLIPKSCTQRPQKVTGRRSRGALPEALTESSRVLGGTHCHIGQGSDGWRVACGWPLGVSARKHKDPLKACCYHICHLV
jgi:hypothetical protein